MGQFIQRNEECEVRPHWHAVQTYSSQPRTKIQEGKEAGEQKRAGTFGLDVLRDVDFVLGCKPRAEPSVMLESTKGLIVKGYAEMQQVPQDLPTEAELVPNSTKRALITQNA